MYFVFFWKRKIWRQIV